MARKEYKPFFKSFIKAVPFMNMFIPETKDEYKNIYKFGKDNLLPNKLMRWVLDSGVAKRTSSKRAAYIAADGFVDEKAAEIQVNPTQTADKILTEISGYQSYFKGFALHVKRKGGQLELNVLPFQDIRKTLDGRFSYNPTYSASKFDRSKEQIIEPFKGIKVSGSDLQRISANGELIYAYHRSADNPHYPIPDYYAGIEDIRTGAELQKLDLEAVVNGFMPSAILTLIGNMDDVSKDDAGMTEKDYFDENLESFTGNVKDAEGRSGRMRLLITNARTKEEAPTLQAFDAKAIIDASNSKREIIERSICRLFGVNPVIAGFSDVQVLGNQQAMANASNELNNEVICDQQLISSIFEMVYPEYDWTITSFRPINYIPDNLYDVLSVNEKRAIIGYPEIKDNDTTDN